MAVDRRELGRRLRLAREAAGLSQREVASRAGFAHARISEYERGLRDLTVDRLQALADALGAELRIELDAHEQLDEHDRQMVAMALARTPRQRLDVLVRLHRLRGRAVA